MDPAGVAVDKFHFSEPTQRANDVMETIRYKPRREVTRVNYFLIDTGISIMFPPDPHYRSLSGSWGAEKSIPEHQAHVKGIDPFHTDVCQMGMVLKRFVKVNPELPGMSFYILMIFS